MRSACACALRARAGRRSDEQALTFGLPYVHSAFDVAAWLSSIAVFWVVTRRLLPEGAQLADKVSHPGAYALAAGCGALVGAMFFGTLNTWLSGVRAIGFSMAGGLAGAIASVELFKHLTGVRGSTGIAFAAPFCATVAVGRLGCFFAGLDDYTYGTPTSLPWAVDFGDGVHRHPVQLYEALAMAAMLVVLLWRLKKRDPFWLANGFYIVAGWYGLQRFAWEFLKPYASFAGPFNVFHLVCLSLVLYAAVMIRRGGRDVRRRSA